MVEVLKSLKNLESHEWERHVQLMPTSKVAPSVRQSCVTLLVTSQIEEDVAIVNNQILQGALSSVATLTTAPVSISTKNDVQMAEVLWALKISSSHYSHKSSKLLFTKCFLIV